MKDKKSIEPACLPALTTDFQVPLNAISTPTLVLTPDFTMVAANDARLRVTMSRREDIMGRPLFEVFPDNPDDASAEGVRNLKASLERVLRDKVPDTMPIQKYDIPTSSSDCAVFKVRYWSPTNIPILGPDGEVTHILHQVQDVTEVILGKDRQEVMTSEIYARTNEVRSINAALKIAKEELEKKVAERTAALSASEKRFREIANAMPQIVWTSTADGVVTWYNDWWYEYTGAVLDTEEDQDCLNMHPDDIEPRTKLWEESLATGQTFEAEIRFRRGSDGQYRWHLGRAVTVRDSMGSIIQWVGSHTDIHDQKVAEEALRASETRFRTLLETVPHMVWYMRPSGEIVFISRQWQDYTGVEMDTVSIGAAWERVIHPDDRESVSESIKIAAENHCLLVTAPHRFKRADGSYRWNLGHGNPIFDENGEFKGWIGTTTDIHEQKTAEDALKESESRFRALADAVPGGVYISDQDGAIVYQNQRFWDYVGRSADEAEGWNWQHLPILHTDDLQPTIDAWKAAIDRGDYFESEYRLRGRDGEYRWFLSRAFPYRNEYGDIISWYGTNTDIHAQKILQEQLAMARQTAERSREEMHGFFMQAPVAIVMFTGPEHLYTLANPLYEQFVGRKVVGKTVRQVLSEQEAGLFIPLLDRVYQTGSPYIGKELPLDIPDEQGVNQSHFLTIGYHPFCDETGDIKGIFAVLIDETDQVKARKQIEESEAQLRELADAMPQLVIVSSADGNAIYTNQRARDYFGGASQEIEDWQCRPQDFFHPDDQTRAVESWLESVRTGNVHQIEYRIRRYDGEYRWHLGRAVPIRDEHGRISKWYATNTDIHEQKLLAEELSEARQAAESANATKSAFLANMSHEIRTPLAAIIGFSELLRESDLSFEERDQYLETVIRSGHGLTRIIDDILDLAKVEAGRLEIEEVEFSIFGFMQEVLDLFRDKAKQKGIYLFLNIDDEVPPHIISDPTRLRQILVNLIGNALKFTTKGGVRMNVKSASQEHGRVELIVSVKDTGIGLTAAQKEKLFEPFVQADNSTTREYGGTGLGLVLSRRLAHALGGNITIGDCKEAQGCTFVLSFRSVLPVEALDIEPHGKDESIRGPDNFAKNARLSSFKVLLADDSTDNQFLIARILKKHGASVEIAHDGEEAIRKALDSDFDLILMDIQMPRVDGYEATRALRSNGYTKPIIALTAHAMSEERSLTRAAGCTGHLTKPINQPELIDTIEILAHRKRSSGLDENRLQ